MPSPNDFFLGIGDFFGQLVPGAVLVAVLYRLGVIPGVNDSPSTVAGLPHGWSITALIVAAYLVGHFVSVLASSLDSSYDAVRKLRWPLGNDKAYSAAKAVRDKQYPENVDAMNMFQWSKAVLLVHCRDAFDEVARFEATSKLFRTLVLDALIIAVVCAAQGNLDGAMLGVAAAVLSFWPYVDRRYKSTEMAYRHVIVYLAGGGSK